MTKDLFLKISKIKDINEFYSKFPSEEAFMKVHGKAFKKALLGASIDSAENGINYKFGQYSNTPGQLGYNLSGDENGQQFNLEGQPMSNNSVQQSVAGKSDPTIMGDSKLQSNVMQGVNAAGELVGGIRALSGEKKKLRGAKQMQQLSDVELLASRTRPEEVRRRYVRPEDMITSGEELYPAYGTGTNVLGKDGVTIRKAENGFTNFMNSGGEGFANNMVKSAFNNNAGSQIGGAVGDAIKIIPGVGPIISTVAKPILSAIGGLIDNNGRKIKRAQQATDKNISNMSVNNNIQDTQYQNSSYMEDGGNMNGDLQTYKGGYAEPISYNPFLPDNGETVMFRGASHDDGGIEASYGNNSVEVEGGEPATKLEDGGGMNNMVVFGNLPISKTFADALGDPSAKNKKFKNYVADLSKTESRQNNIVENSVDKLDGLELSTPFSKLELNAHKANILGANMKLKEIAEKKNRASALQEAINSVAEEHGIIAEDFAKGKITKAKKGATIPTGDSNSKFPWMEAINATVPYFRPSNAEPLDANQLTGEMFALSNNQLEPVQAQTYTPQLDTPYDVSYQDIRNNNQADYNASKRIVGNNPEAISILNAQKYNANEKVGAEEFRANQEMRNKVYAGNRATMNDARLKNLGIYDQQYTRQANAQTNTKNVAQVAISSISDKQAKNKLENKTLQTYENLYNYRYDNQGRAINMNPLATFNTSGTNLTGNNLNLPEGYEYTYRTVNGKLVPDDIKKKVKDKSRNGAIVNAIKNL